MTIDQPTPDPTVDELLVESVTRLFAEVCSFDAVQTAEADGWAPEVWRAVADAGFAWIGIPEEAGGSGGTIADACAVLRAAGAHAAPIPLAETGLLGGWALARAGLPLPDGPVTVVPGRPDDTLAATEHRDGTVELRGTAHRVPWAAQVERIVVVAPSVTTTAHHVLLVPPAAVTITPATNLAGEPRPTVSFDDYVVPASDAALAPAPVTVSSLRLRGALTRASLMAGALEAMSRLTVGYTDQRVQFGRPVGRFQAVQQHLVWGAQDAALALMAAEVAAREATRIADGLARFEIAAARTVADEAALTATRWAHQAHGAMGMTQEYALHHLSRRLWAWRGEYSGPAEWATEVGRLAGGLGADGLYPLIAS
ncbi:MAG: acyl-CoA dehydrogenase family protein [Acidimicrobiales bacterium]